MITAEQAKTEHYFHVSGQCSLTMGKRGRIIIEYLLYRRNGQFRQWHNGGWRLPLKRGMYEYGEINNASADKFHLEKDCAVLQEAKRIRELDDIEVGDLVEAKYTVVN